MWKNWMALACTVGMLVGCGSTRGDLVMMETAAEATGDATSMYEEGVALFEKREDAASLDAALLAWEEAAKLDPSHLETQNKLAYGYYYKAHSHDRWIEDEDEAMEAMKVSYLKGMEAGARALKIASPKFAERVKAGESWETAIEEVGPEGLHAMYWHAANLGKWGLLDSIATILRYKDRAFGLVERVYELDKNFGYGAAPRYFGAAALKVPVGKDPEKSKKMFMESMEIAPNHLDTKLLYAEFYLVYEQNEEEFIKVLNEALETPDDAIPGREPETRNAKRMAKQMLDNIEDYF